MKIVKKLTNKCSNVASKTKMRMKKHAPEILLITGIVATGAAIVTACKATMKVEKILDEHKEAKEKIEKAVADKKSYEEDGKKHEYTAEVAKKDKACLWRDTVIKFVKNYAIPGSLFIIGMTCFCASTVILRKREKAAVALANGTLAAWNAYRARVREAVGERAEEDIYFDRKEDPSMTIIEEDGKIVKAKTPAKDPGHPFVFHMNSQTCKFWEDDMQYNLIFVQRIQEEFDGRVFDADFGGDIVELNTVLKKLGMDKCGNCMTAGWVPEKMGGHVKHISFGLEKYKKPDDQGGIDIYAADEIILEFNCELIDEFF